MDALKYHNRFNYEALPNRAGFEWPNHKRLAVYIGFNIEHFHFGSGLGANLGPSCPEPDVLNYMWRDYGNRVGVWRCLDLFEQLKIPTGAIINTALYEYCPEVIQALLSRGDELIGHGHTNSERQGTLGESQELELIKRCREIMKEKSGVTPTGWLSPWISESLVTPDLLSEAHYAYTLNWCHDDQPTRVKTRQNLDFWSIPYPQELNDIPMIMHRQMDAVDFSQMIIDQFDEMMYQAYKGTIQKSLVMGIALHPYIVGQPYRLKHLRNALTHISKFKDDIWITTPGDICKYMNTL